MINKWGDGMHCLRLAVSCMYLKGEICFFSLKKYFAVIEIQYRNRFLNAISIVVTLFM